MHFTVAVFSNNINEVDNLLAPFCEHDENYFKFIDQTPYLSNEWRNESIEAVRCPDGKIRFKWDEMFRVPGTYGFNFAKNGAGSHVVPEGYIIEMIPYREMYPTFDEFCTDYHEYKRNEYQYGYYANPNSEWDWYDIGGRWLGILLVKDEVNSIIGEPGVYKNSIPEAPQGYKYVDSAKVSDIEWDQMKEFGTYSVLTSDGKWHEKGYGDSQINDWDETYFEKFIKANWDKVITIVDCHI